MQKGELHSLEKRPGELEPWARQLAVGSRPASLLSHPVLLYYWNSSLCLPWLVAPAGMKMGIL